MDPVLCVCVCVCGVWCRSPLAQYRLKITEGAVLVRREALAKSKHATHAVCADAVDVVCMCVRPFVRASVRTCVNQDGESPVEIDEPQIDEPQVHGFRL